MSHNLTARQQETLQIIEDSVRDRGVSPSLREIGRALGVTSTNGVSEHVRALQKKGYIRVHDVIARGLVPLASYPLMPATPSNDAVQVAAPPSDEECARLRQELAEAHSQLAEMSAQLEDAQVVLNRKDRRIERLETLLGETRLALREASLASVG